MNSISKYILLMFFVTITLPLCAGKHERDASEESVSKKQKTEAVDCGTTMFTEDKLEAARKKLIKHPLVMHDEIEINENTNNLRLFLEVATREDLARLDDYGLTLLHNAALAEDNAEEKVNLILDKSAALGLQKELLAAQDIHDRTPLMIALQEGMRDTADLLIKAGSDLSAQDNDGKTVMHFAALGGLDTLIMPLVRLGVSPEVPNTQGRVPLHYACKAGHSKVIKSLLDAGVRCTIQDHQDNTPLHYAARLKDPTAARLLIRARAHIDAFGNQGKTPLIIALQNGAFKTAQILVDAGACVETTLKTMTPLHMLVTLWSHEGDVPLNPPLLELKGHKLGLLKSLLAQGANIVQRDDYQATPLHYAITSHHSGLVKALLFDSYLPYGDDTINSSYHIPSWLEKLSWKAQRITALRLMRTNCDGYIDFLNRHIERHFLALKRCVALVQHTTCLEESEEIYRTILAPVDTAQKFSGLPVEFQERIRATIFKRFSRKN